MRREAKLSQAEQLEEKARRKKQEAEWASYIDDCAVDLIIEAK
jgi:hypothetical protein